MCLRNFPPRALFAASCRDCLQNGSWQVFRSPLPESSARTFPRNKRDRVAPFVRISFHCARILFYIFFFFFFSTRVYPPMRFFCRFFKFIRDSESDRSKAVAGERGNDARSETFQRACKYGSKINIGRKFTNRANLLCRDGANYE